MSELLAKCYEELPYLSKPFYSMHPDRLASVGILAGLDTVPVDQCRVLELGCAGGGHLIPMADGLPQSSFVGIDLAPRQIREGQSSVDRLGLKNIQLRAMNIMDVGRDFGQFDYIVCHGVYSWVPSEVQAKTLDICRENLSPNGLVCISYNTYPGWHRRMMVREMMLYHIDPTATPKEQVGQARELLEQLDSMLTASGLPNGCHAVALREELKRLRESEDHYVFHEFLEPFNQPLYFHQFVARAAENGLQYVNRATWDSRTAQVMGAFQNSPLASPDPIRFEQYLDFLTGNTFRRSVLCHQGRTPIYAGDVDALSRLSIVGQLQIKGTPTDLASAQPATFVALNHVEMTVGDPVVKAALTILAQVMPTPTSFENLCGEIQRRARGSSEPMPAEDRRRLGLAVLQCYRADIVELHTHLPTCLLTLSDKPKVTSFARLQASEGSEGVTNLRHRQVDFPPLDLFVVSLLDGTHDRAAIVSAVEVAVDAPGSTALSVSPPAREAIPGLVDQALERISRSAMLIA